MLPSLEPSPPPPSSTSSQSRSSFPIAGVTSGILGTLIVISIICAFTWYKVKTAQRDIADRERNPERNEGGKQNSASEIPSANLSGTANPGVEREAARSIEE